MTKFSFKEKMMMLVGDSDNVCIGSSNILTENARYSRERMQTGLSPFPVI